MGKGWAHVPRELVLLPRRGQQSAILWAKGRQRWESKGRFAALFRGGQGGLAVGRGMRRTRTRRPSLQQGHGAPGSTLVGAALGAERVVVTGGGFEVGAGSKAKRSRTFWTRGRLLGCQRPK